MINIILSGCNGKMGKFISSVISDRDDCRVVAGFDINTQANDGFPVFAQPDDYKGEADVIIDFSHPSSLEKLLKYAKENTVSPQWEKACKDSLLVLQKNAYLLTPAEK